MSSGVCVCERDSERPGCVLENPTLTLVQKNTEQAGGLQAESVVPTVVAAGRGREAVGQSLATRKGNPWAHIAVCGTEIVGWKQWRT